MGGNTEHTEHRPAAALPHPFQNCHTQHTCPEIEKINKREERESVRVAERMPKGNRKCQEYKGQPYLEQDKLISVREEHHSVLHGVVLLLIFLLTESSV